MILLIAYGNPLRQDDGAGLRLAERMVERWQAADIPLRHLAVQQLTPELAAEIAEPGVAAVVLVDARAVDADAAKNDPAALAVAVMPLAAPDAASPSLGHHMGPATLLAYTGLLLDGRPAPRAWLVTTPGVDFEHGEGLSEAAKAAIEAVFDDQDQQLLSLMNSLADESAASVRSCDFSRSGSDND